MALIERFSERRFFAVGAVILLAATCAAYWNSLSGPCIFDDELSIVGNPSIRTLWPPWAALHPPHGSGAPVEGRPLLNLSLAFNYALGGTSVTGYHLVNIAIHAAAALVLFAVIRLALRNSRTGARLAPQADATALIASLWWSAHPLQTESVTYIIQRAESLAALFYLLTLYAFLRGMDSTRRSAWFAGAALACLLGSATKET